MFMVHLKIVSIILQILWISDTEVINDTYLKKDSFLLKIHSYPVRSMGMTRIWSTTASLTHVATNKTITEFPLIKWNASANNTGSVEESSTHEPWTIPVNIPLGNYSLTISGK